MSITEADVKAAEINSLHNALTESSSGNFECLVGIGRLLHETKKIVGHGNWAKWVVSYLQFGSRQASKYMAIQEHAIEIRAQIGITTSDLLGVDRMAKLAKQSCASDPVIHPIAEAKALGTISNLQDLVDGGELFSTIYADPPWRYGNQGTRAATNDHYSTMTVADICAEPVSQIVSENAHLHMWTTNAFLEEAFSVIRAWGFTYKSCFVWVKPQMGIGNYWRVSHEFLLFGTRGKCPFGARNEMSWGNFNRTRHSSKPDEIRKKIERVSPGPFLEMYGRKTVKKWTVYGNQVRVSEDQGNLVFDEKSA